MENNNEIQVSKTARYYTFGNDVTKAKRIWLACHGYGQLGKYFIRNFHGLDPETHFVIAPEGLHRFYLEGFSGRVGATWMTKEARLDDIADYVRYLDAVMAHFGFREKRPDQEICAFGFSQGVATISRWIVMGGFQVDRAIFWAGSFPPDLEPVRSKQIFRDLTTTCVTGDSDPFISEVQLKATREHLSAIGIHPEWIGFKGGHVILPEVLAEVVEGFQ